MAINDFDFTSNKFWRSLSQRLETIGVDLQARFGPDWMDVFERAFSRWDLASARLALEARSTEGSWIIDIGPQAERIATTDLTVYADTMSDGLAFLLSRATAEGLFPDSVNWDPEHESIQFLHRGEQWAQLFRATPTPSGDAARSRAASSLIGVRGHSQAGQELLRRLRRWPGVETLTADEEGAKLDNRAQLNHFPDPKEWRASAKDLLAQLGLPTDEKLVQRLLCAVFEAPSWNHLTASIKRYRAAGMQPVAVIANTDTRHDLVGVYADYLDALPHFLHRAALKASEWGGMCLADLGIHGVPDFYLRAPTKDRHDRWSAPCVTLSMLSRVGDEDEDQRTRLVVDSMLGSEMGVSQEVLEELFMIRAAPESRRRLVEKLGNLRLIAEEAGWRFHEWSGGHELCLMVERVDDSGNRLKDAVYVPYRKAQILLVQPTGLYAVTSEYHGRHPELALDISATTAARVAATLPEMRTALWPEARFDKKDANTFADLVASMPRL